MDIDITWAASGLADAARYGIGYHEVIDAVYADTSVGVHIGDGPARLIWLGGQIGRVLVITADREARTISAYRITEVRPATDGESRAWEKRQS